MDGIGKELEANRVILDADIQDADIQDQEQWSQNVSTVFDIKKDNAVADAFLGCEIFFNWPAIGWIEGEIVKRNVDRRKKTGSDIVNFFDFYTQDDDTSNCSI